MTLPLPFKVQDSDVQDNFDVLAQQFPLAHPNIASTTVAAQSGTLAPSSITSGTYATFTGAPSITILISGSHLVTISGSADAAAPDGTGQVFLSYSLNGGAAVDANAVRWRSVNFNSGSRTFKVTGLLRNDVLALQAKQVGASPGRIFEADISAIRI